MNGVSPNGLPATSWLTLLTLLPFTGAFAVALLGRSRPALARAMALVIAAASLLVALFLWLRLDANIAAMQFEEIHAWAPSLGIAYHAGVDGFGLLMVTLSAIVVLMSLTSSWGNPRQGPAYFALVLLLEAGLFGTFTALNFIHWFLYWELTLIPAFFLVRLWGGKESAPASTQFFLYTMAGSLALLLAFLAIYLATGSFDFVELAALARDGHLSPALAQHTPGANTATILFWAVFFGFAVKTPVVPFHTWLPTTYAEAASETTMLLTGAMSKMGIYGFLRILLPIFPKEMQRAATPLLWFALASIVLPALAAWLQRDLKRTFAYSSINHLGYCVLGVCAAAKITGTDSAVANEKAAALTGVVLQIFSHGITAAAIFWFLALLERRSGGLRGLDDFGGLRKAVPILTGLMGIAIFASLGLPGLSGFPGEFLILKGVFPLAPRAASLALLGLLMTAVFLLNVIQKVFTGPLNPRWATMPDLSPRELLALAPVIALLFVLGLDPQLIAGPIHATVMHWAGQWATQVRF
jgi:NADH-quinone oxidoreductase subunit M